MTRRNLQMLSWGVMLCFLGTRPVAAALTVIADASNFLDMDVPDPDHPGQCKAVEFGELAGRLAVDAVQQYVVIGFRKTYTGPTCCDTLRFLNVVVQDPTPPGWKDKKGKKTQIKRGEIYIDPLSGGNIQPGKDEAKPAADRKPWYDGVVENTKASKTGDFSAGEQTSMDLDNVKNGDLDWTGNPTLDLFFGDAPTLTNGLEFVTLLVCVDGMSLCPVGGIAWGRTAGGVNHIDWPFSAANYPAGLTSAKIQAAFTRSGFPGYTVRDSCCPCRAPAPSSVLLGTMGLLALNVVRRRRLVGHG